MRGRYAPWPPRTAGQAFAAALVVFALVVAGWAADADLTAHPGGRLNGHHAQTVGR